MELVVGEEGHIGVNFALKFDKKWCRLCSGRVQRLNSLTMQDRAGNEQAQKSCNFEERLAPERHHGADYIEACARPILRSAPLLRR